MVILLWYNATLYLSEITVLQGHTVTLYSSKITMVCCGCGNFIIVWYRILLVVMLVLYPMVTYHTKSTMVFWAVFFLQW